MIEHYRQSFRTCNGNFCSSVFHWNFLHQTWGKTYRVCYNILITIIMPEQDSINTVIKICFNCFLIFLLNIRKLERSLVWISFTIVLIAVNISRLFIATHFPHQVVAGLITGKCMIKFRYTL